MLNLKLLSFFLINNIKADTNNTFYNYIYIAFGCLQGVFTISYGGTKKKILDFENRSGYDSHFEQVS